MIISTKKVLKFSFKTIVNVSQSLKNTTENRRVHENEQERRHQTFTSFPKIFDNLDSVSAGDPNNPQDRCRATNSCELEKENKSEWI